jgi:hypothetical protein
VPSMDGVAVASVTFLRYAREQGLAGDGIEPEGLFAPETRDALAI